jgi:hypothetical protein
VKYIQEQINWQKAEKKFSFILCVATVRLDALSSVKDHYAIKSCPANGSTIEDDILYVCIIAGML